MKLTDREWEEFDLTHLFEDIQRGKRLTKSNQVKGETPYVSSSAMNNGVDNFISNVDKVRRFANCISLANSGSVGSTFYHPYEFVASDHVTHLKSSSMNQYTYMFVATIMNRLTNKYNFNREINDKRIKREKIMLPTNEKKEPDYDFMESYIKSLMGKGKRSYESYCKEVLKDLSFIDIVPLENKKWAEFTIKELFNVYSGVRLTKNDMTIGDRPFIGSTDSKNGITNFVSNTNNSLASNVLGVNYNGSVCEAFYHPYECIFSDDVKHLELKSIQGNKYLYLFLSTVIRQQKSKYTYGYKFNGNRMNRQKIMIPVNEDGNPDYEYMEQYTKNLMFNKYNNYLKR